MEAGCGRGRVKPPPKATPIATPWSLIAREVMRWELAPVCPTQSGLCGMDLSLGAREVYRMSYALGMTHTSIYTHVVARRTQYA